MVEAPLAHSIAVARISAWCVDKMGVRQVSWRVSVQGEIDSIYGHLIVNLILDLKIGRLNSLFKRFQRGVGSDLPSLAYQIDPLRDTVLAILALHL